MVWKEIVVAWKWAVLVAFRTPSCASSPPPTLYILKTPTTLSECCYCYSEFECMSCSYVAAHLASFAFAPRVEVECGVDHVLPHVGTHCLQIPRKIVWEYRECTLLLGLHYFMRWDIELCGRLRKGKYFEITSIMLRLFHATPWWSEC